MTVLGRISETRITSSVDHHAHDVAPQPHQSVANSNANGEVEEEKAEKKAEGTAE